MKKVILLIITVFFLTGCISVNQSTYEQIINYAFTSEKNIHNKSFNGYSFYLPPGITVLNYQKNNITLKKGNYYFYMYIDTISYYNKRKESYQKNDALVSIPIKNEEKFGYLEINKTENEKYLVEIMYNYAKIEVIVDECDLKETVSYAISILNSITYNDTILGNMIGEDVLNYNEVEFNIFETAKNKSNLIEYDGDSTNDLVEDDVPDTDLIN